MDTGILIMIILILLAIVIAIPSNILINWSVYKQTAKESKRKYGWGTYNIFIKEFNKREWILDGGSLSAKDNENCWNMSKLYDGRILFSGVEMLLPIIDYMKATRFIKNKIKFLSKAEEQERIITWE